MRIIWSVFFVYFTTLLLSLCMIAFFIGKAFGAEILIPEDQAIRAIIGEASNQGYEGMLAVACAIRNRGHLRGVYGLKAKHVDREPVWVWDRARKAWHESAGADIVKGADHWENVKAFGLPSWAERMTKTVQIGDHAFFKS